MGIKVTVLGTANSAKNEKGTALRKNLTLTYSQSCKN